MIELMLVAALSRPPRVSFALPPRKPSDCRVILASGVTRGNSNRWWLPPTDVGMGGREAWLDYCESRASKKRGWNFR